MHHQDVADKSRILLNYHRHEIKRTLEGQLGRIVRDKQMGQERYRAWKSIIVIKDYYNKLQARFNKYQAMFHRDVLEYFMARRI